MKLHDRIVRARALFSDSSATAILDRRPAAPGADEAMAPTPSTQAAHHLNHMDRRTAKSTRTVANHHPHHKAD